MNGVVRRLTAVRRQRFSAGAAAHVAELWQGVGRHIRAGVHAGNCARTSAGVRDVA